MQPGGVLGLAWAVLNRRQVFFDNGAIPNEIYVAATSRGVTILTDPSDVPSRKPTGIYTRRF